jgi:hypothetical protein
MIGVINNERRLGIVEVSLPQGQKSFLQVHIHRKILLQGVCLFYPETAADGNIDWVGY